MVDLVVLHIKALNTALIIPWLLRRMIWCVRRYVTPASEDCADAWLQPRQDGRMREYCFRPRIRATGSEFCRVSGDFWNLARQVETIEFTAIYHFELTEQS